MNRNIGWAVSQLQSGKRVCRSGWNGKGMFLFLVPADWLDEWALQESVAMKTAQGTAVPWLCSQSDLLADDWEVAA